MSEADGAASWLSPAQTAHRLGVTPKRVVQLTRSGRLEYVRTPLGRLIDPESVERLRVARRLANSELPPAS